MANSSGTKNKNRIVFLGDGLLNYHEYFKERLKDKVEFSSPEYWYPKASNLLFLAEDKLKKGKLTDPYKLVPLYLYPKECQIRNV